MVMNYVLARVDEKHGAQEFIEVFLRCWGCVILKGTENER